MKKAIALLLGLGVLTGTGIAGYKLLESPRYGVYQTCKAIESRDIKQVKERIDLNAIAGQVINYYAEQLGSFTVAIGSLFGLSDATVEKMLEDSIANATEENIKKLNCLEIARRVEIQKTEETAEVTFRTKIEEAENVPISVEMTRQGNVWRISQVKGETLKLLGNAYNAQKN
jgi:hypothetical protein